MKTCNECQFHSVESRWDAVDGVSVWESYYHRCDRLIKDKYDPVTGEKLSYGYLSCKSERSSWSLLFWKDRCGPEGKYFKQRNKE